ncbi:hypothetical protein [Chryseobacterium culicis]|uniref:hypothetical protein n=1 Tax=Chryseobacterium culicis TaxID=680127 RepID=UPI0018770908|nr:hypothetical protein [Chryseobacterium culicis]MBE4948263.1 hypothetical protein [Chryseobacterium culicis]
MKYKLKSELTEKQIESDIATYLGWCTPPSKQPFRLIDVNEQITGADKRFDNVFPIYLQFKVSEGLRPLTGPILNPYFKRFPLNKIRTFRQSNFLNDNPSLYFKLRDLAKTATELQHNILLKFANTGFSQAMYVAPLTLSKREYEEKLFNRHNRFMGYPFFDEDYEIYDYRWVSHIFQVPFLREHISIIPHERVLDSNHYYSFTNTGTEVAFHSPLLLDNKDARFSTTLSTLFDEMILNLKQERYYFESVIKATDKILETDYISDYNRENGLEILQQIGKEIYFRYDIRQFLLVFDSRKIIR